MVGNFIEVAYYLLVGKFILTSDNRQLPDKRVVDFTCLCKVVFIIQMYCQDSSTYDFVFHVLEYRNE